MKGLAKFKFIGKISNMGDNRIIWIPKEFHEKISVFEGKQIRIVMDDEL
jgi:hypothetical protein